MSDYECNICLNKPLVADIMSSWLSEARVNLTFLPASSHPHPPVPCPVPCAPMMHLCPDKPLIHWSSSWGSTEILSMCQLLLRQTQNRLLTATCMCVCLTKMCTEEWQDHPVPEIKHKGDQTTRNWAVLQLFYRVHQSFSLHYTEHSLLLKFNGPETFACLKQHAF